jgi:aspartate 1-decarboxylase
MPERACERVVGDKIIIFVTVISKSEIQDFKPKIVHVNATNRIVRKK